MKLNCLSNLTNERLWGVFQESTLHSQTCERELDLLVDD